MTRQLEAKREERQAKRDRAVLQALEYGFLEGVEATGVDLVGLSVRWSVVDCLVTIRGSESDSPVVCFVGGETLSSCLVKVMQAGPQGKLHWRPDKYGG